MKPYLFYAMVLMSMTSCNQVFYQAIKTQSDNVKPVAHNELAYEDDDCIITYNLWQNRGNIGFLFTNKTDQDIFIDLRKSFFVMNDMAHDYYLGRTFTHSKSVSVSKQKGASIGGKPTTIDGNLDYELISFSSGSKIRIDNATLTASMSYGSSNTQAVSVEEQPIVCIPAHSSKYIEEYIILPQPYRECEFARYPSTSRMSSNEAKIKILRFSEKNSPVKFSNHITYSIGDNKVSRKVVNSFYANEITNLPKKVALQTKVIRTDCAGNKLRVAKRVKIMKDGAPQNFYIRYMKEGLSADKY